MTTSVKPLNTSFDVPIVKATGALKNEGSGIHPLPAASLGAIGNQAFADIAEQVQAEKKDN